MSSVKIGRNRHGNLFLRLYLNGVESREGTALKDTPENRQQLEIETTRLNRQMADGTFDYLREFPRGNKADYFRRAVTAPNTIREYYEKWVGRYEPPLAKPARYENYRSNFECHILPHHGDRLLQQYGLPDIRELMSILARAGLQPKSIKNYLNASLRAMFRDAKLDRLVDRNPFDDLPARFWPAVNKPPPDPFLPEERDEIINYFAQKYGTSWRHAYALIFALFWTGARPSELVGRTWNDIDLRTGMFRIHTSMVRHTVGDNKTAGSNRTIRLFPPVIKIFEAIKPLRVQHGDYIFLDRHGDRPIDQGRFGQDVFQPALTVLKIRHRDFYCTRHTFITTLLKSEHPKKVAEYVGSSPAMIYKNYAGALLTHSDGFGSVAMVEAGLVPENAILGDSVSRK